MVLLKRKLLTVLGTSVVVLAACTGGGASTAPTTAPTTAASAGTSAEPGASASAAAGGECGITVNADGSVAPLEDGFPNQPITIISIDDPGAPDGVYALTMKAAIEDNKITDQRVTVIDRPDFGTYGTWEGLEFINNDAAGADGYIMAVATIPGATVDLLATDVVDKLGAQIEKLNIVMSTEYVPYVMTSKKNAPWGNDFGKMIEAAQAAPNTLKYISRGPGSGLDLAFKNYSQIAAKAAGLAEGEEGIPVEEVIGGSHAEINAVLGAGEGDIAMTLSDVGKQFYDDGRVEVLTFSGNAPAPQPFTVKTAKEFFGPELLPSDPWGQNRTLFAGTNVPDCHYQWLVKMVEQATATPQFQEARLKVPGLTLQALTREQMWELSNTAVVAACPILKAADLIDPTAAARNPC
jgi:tripartite-type tricarboxylate transporter receptor subunit TctC